MTVQLMSMKKHGIIAEELWQEILQLRTNNHLVPQEIQAVNNAMIRIAQDLSGCRGQFPDDFPISGMVREITSIHFELSSATLVVLQSYMNFP